MNKPIIYGKYTVTFENGYLFIKHSDFQQNIYQLKLEDEGLVLDVVGAELQTLFHCMNSEVLPYD